MRIFGIHIPPRRLSDEEYVEKVRKRLQTARRLRYVHAALAVAYFALIIWMITVCTRVLTLPGDQESEQHLIYLTFVLAILLGILVGMGFIKAGQSIALTLFAHRGDRLLVEFWDVLNPDRRDEKNS